MHNNLKLFLFCLSLVGCSGQTTLEEKVESYAERIARVTESETHLPSPNLALGFPNAAKRKINIPSTSLNLREFYAIKGCPLATLVAQRNTTLGKVEAPELRYAYESQLLQTLAQCGELINSDNIDLKDELQRLQTFKTTNLPLTFADMLQNSRAIIAGLSFASDFIGTEQTATEITQSIAAIHYLANISNMDNAKVVDISEMNAHLQILEQGQVWARIWRSQQYLIQVLPSITKVLDSYSKDINCRVAQTDLDILRNVMLMFFIDYIQPLASTIVRAHEQSSSAWLKLLDEPALQPNMKAFILAHTDTHHAEFKKTITAHVTTWQELFSLCSMSPTGR